MTFEFKPGRGKPAAAITLTALKAGVHDRTYKIEGAKSTGGGIIKVFTTGDSNYYIPVSVSLHKFLLTQGVEI